MKPKWTTIPLGDVLQPVERGEKPHPGKLYRQLGVKLWGVGAYERETIDGSQTQYKTLSRVEADDIVVNKIWARNGSVAVVTEDLAGCYVSGEFPTFAPIREKLEPRWMHWLTKTPGFWHQCDERARGTSGKNRIRPEEFLRVEIPLPPVTEQRRIVARIEQLANQVEEARRLRQEAVRETEQLLSKVIMEVMSDIRDTTQPLLTATTKKTGAAYEASDFSDSDGVPVVRLKEIETKSPTVFLRAPEKYANVWLEEGDIVLAKTSWSTGAMCMWPGPRSVLNQNAVMLRAKPPLDQKFLFLWLKQHIVRYLKDHLADPNYYPYIRETDLMSWQVPIPPADEQQRIVEYLDGLAGQVTALTQLQSETAAELDAMLPSILDRAFKGEL